MPLNDLPAIDRLRLQRALLWQMNEQAPTWLRICGQEMSAVRLSSLLAFDEKALRILADVFSNLPIRSRKFDEYSVSVMRQSGLAAIRGVLGDYIGTDTESLEFRAHLVLGWLFDQVIPYAVDHCSADDLVEISARLWSSCFMMINEVLPEEIDGTIGTT